MEVQRDRGTEGGKGRREKKGWRNRGTGGGRDGGREGRMEGRGEGDTRSSSLSFIILLPPSLPLSFLSVSLPLSTFLSFILFLSTCFLLPLR